MRPGAFGRSAPSGRRNRNWRTQWCDCDKPTLDRMKIRPLLVSLAFSFVSTAFAAEPRIGKFVQYDAGEFVVVTSRSGAQARRIMEDLVKFRLTLERVLGKRATPNAFPTTIVITSASDWNNWLRPGQNV